MLPSCLNPPHRFFPPYSCCREIWVGRKPSPTFSAFHPTHVVAKFVGVRRGLVFPPYSCCREIWFVLQFACFPPYLCCREIQPATSKVWTPILSTLFMLSRNLTTTLSHDRQSAFPPYSYCRETYSHLLRPFPPYQSCREILPPPTCDLCFPPYSCCREIYAHDVQFRYFFFHPTHVVAKYPAR
jgi:hypothetical protein